MRARNHTNTRITENDNFQLNLRGPFICLGNLKHLFDANMNESYLSPTTYRIQTRKGSPLKGRRLDQGQFEEGSFSSCFAIRSQVVSTTIRLIRFDSVLYKPSAGRRLIWFQPQLKFEARSRWEDSLPRKDDGLAFWIALFNNNNATIVLPDAASASARHGSLIEFFEENGSRVYWIQQQDSGWVGITGSSMLKSGPHIDTSLSNAWMASVRMASSTFSPVFALFFWCQLAVSWA